uniref:Zinc finger protein 431-like n=1 Tax=Diabrotica virgifera virgifera TaxID=50390 RepID=A0A6P7GHR7_DIAVI
MTDDILYSMENYGLYSHQLHFKQAQQNCSFSHILPHFSPNVSHIQNNSISYQNQMHSSKWENRTSELEKNKLTDTVDMVDISSKDLSPCSNIEYLDPEMYKDTNKDLGYNKYNQCTYALNSNNQRNYDYTSCVQYEKSVKCYSQKTYDSAYLKSCNFNANGMVLNNETLFKNGNYKFPSYDNYVEYNGYNCYMSNQENNVQVQSDFYTTTNIQLDPVLPSIEMEDSNEDSDIIVEESEGEMANSEDQDKPYQSVQLNKCVICNLICTPFGIQFYYLTSKSPLTMSTQVPVINKIERILGKIPTTKHYVCNDCLGLINTIDHLQLKILTFNNELVLKYKKTCIENKTFFREIKKRPLKNKMKYKCKICNKILCIQKYSLYHLNMHKKPCILCEYCGIMFRSRKKFTVHNRKHAKKNVMPSLFKCKNCTKLFKTRSHLKYHENVCLGLFPFECKFKDCDKKFATNTQHKNHVKLKHEKKFIAICSICNIGFVKISEYKNHKITHSTDKKYSCTKCKNSYKSLCNLKFHMKMHNKQFPFSCMICKKGFLRKEYYETHLSKHTGIKKYKCSICNKQVASQKYLDSHLKSHESKKVSCNICGKLLLNSFKLKDHIRVHNNLKEFECDSCNKKFNTRDSLRKHVKYKHIDT